MSEEKVDKEELADAMEMLGAGYDKTIIRIVKNAENPFVMMDKRPIENKELSWKAKGLLAYLLSRPDDWIIRMKDLVSRSTDGEHSVRGAMKELREIGHIKMIAERKSGKITKWTYLVYEVPILPDSDNQQVEKPQVENRTHTKIDSTKKDSNNIAPNGAKREAVTIEEAIFTDQPVTEEMLDQDKQFEHDAEDAAFLICQNNEHLRPLALAFMLARGIILPYDKKKQTGHRKALKEMYNTKPNRVMPEHITQAVQDLAENSMTVKDLFSVIGTAVALANPAPEVARAETHELL